MQTMILATGSNSVDYFIQDKVPEYACIPVLYRNSLVKQVEKHRPVIVILSALLPGVEDLRDILFKIQQAAPCRVIYLSGINHNPTSLMEMFFLGVRDFIKEPINPASLLEAIYKPANYADAIISLSKEPVFQRNFYMKIQKLLLKSKPPPTIHISPESQAIIKGIGQLLGSVEDSSVEETLLCIEEAICNSIIQKLRSTG